MAQLAQAPSHEFDLDIQDAEHEANANDDWCFNLSSDTDVADEDDFNSDYNGDLDAVLANRFAIDCWHYFDHHFGWGSYDNDDSQLEIFIHTTIAPAVVAQSSKQCDLIQFADGAVDYDILVHEFTHGIIRAPAASNTSSSPARSMRATRTPWASSPTANGAKSKVASRSTG